MKRVKELRESKNLSQLNLGMKIEVAQETISGYEIGRAEPNLETLVKLANCLNTSVDYLLNRTDVKTFDTFNKSDLSEAELNAIVLLRALPKEKREKAFGFIEGLSE